MPSIILIAALSYDRVIGSGEGMPWHVPEEYRRYLSFIEGQTVIMGRRTFEIFGDDLTSAHTLVVSRSAEALPGAVVCGSVESALARARKLGRTIFVAGGGSVYRQTLSLADGLYLSFIKGSYTGDTFFPEFDDGTWDVATREDHPGFEFVAYRRRAVPQAEVSRSSRTRRKVSGSGRTR